MWSQLQQLGTTGLLRTEEDDEKQSAKRFYFCDQPHSEYAHVIFASAANRSLWNVESIHSMCRLDQILRSAELFPSICQQPASSSSSTSQCCPSWTLGHYVALMRNRSSCFDIDESDVNAVFKILEVCSKHYHGLRLSANCDTIVQEGKTGHIKAVPSNIYIDFDTLVN